MALEPINEVIIYDTLDLLSGFTKSDTDYWEARAGVVVRSLQVEARFNLLELLGLKKAANATNIQSLAVKLRADHEGPGGYAETVPAYLNSLPEDRRRELLAEFCRQRYIREVQVGYDEADARRGLATLGNAGVNIPEGVV